MTNAVATIALNWRGTDIQEPFGDAAYMFLEIVRGYFEPSSVRGSDIVVPARVGRLAGVRIRDVRQPVLQGIVCGAVGATAGTTFRAKVDTIMALFDPTVSGTLVATPAGGAARTLASCRTTSILWDDITPDYSRVNIELESIAPEWT